MKIRMLFHASLWNWSYSKPTFTWHKIIHLYQNVLNTFLFFTIFQPPCNIYIFNMLMKCFHKYRIHDFFAIFFFAIKIEFFYWDKKKCCYNCLLSQKDIFRQKKLWISRFRIRENMSQTSWLQSFLTSSFPFFSQNSDMILLP